ncbi:MAG: dienelactone hydrolase family protein, partial [Promethearchaeota archaeon]
FMLNENFGVKKLLIIGYSFGATIGASIADEFDEIIGYVAISYPFSLIPQFISQAYVNKPKFFIMGENDDFTSLPILKKEYEKIPEPKDIRIFKGIDHFWSESEEILANAIFEWFKKNFLK